MSKRYKLLKGIEDPVDYADVNIFVKITKAFARFILLSLAAIIILFFSGVIWIKIHPEKLSSLKDYVVERSNYNLSKSDLQLDIAHLYLHFQNGYLRPSLRFENIGIKNLNHPVLSIDNIDIALNIKGMVGIEDTPAINMIVHFPKLINKVVLQDQQIQVGSQSNSLDVFESITPTASSIRQFIDSNSVFIEYVSQKTMDIELVLTNDRQIRVADIRPTFYKQSKKIKFAADLIFDNHKQTLEIDLDAFSSTSQVFALTKIHNLSSNILNASKIKIPNIDRMHFNAKHINISATIENLSQNNKYEIKVDGIGGNVKIENYIEKAIEIKDGKIDAIFQKDSQRIKDISFDLDGHKIVAAINTKKDKSQNKISQINLGIDYIDVQKLLYYWPQQKLSKVKTWIKKSIPKAGIVLKDSTIKLLTTKDGMFAPMSDKDLDLNIVIKDATLNGIPKIKKISHINANMRVDMNGLDFNFKNASYNKDENKITSNVRLLFNKKLDIDINASYKGALDEIFAMMTSDDTSKNIKNLKGQLSSDFTMQWNKSMTSDEILSGIKSKSRITSASFDYGRHDITGATFDAITSRGMLKISGSSRIWKTSDLVINLDRDLNKKHQKLKMSLRSSWGKLQKLYDFIPKELSKSFVANISINQEGRNLSSQTKIDITNSHLQYDILDISKDVGVKANIAFNVNTNGNLYDVKDYTIDLPRFYSKGNAKFDKDGNLSTISSLKTILHDGNFKLSAKIDRKKNTAYVDINGDTVDLNALNLRALRSQKLQNTASQLDRKENDMSIVIKTKLNRIKLKNSMMIKRPVFNATCTSGKCKSLILMGIFEKDNTSYIDINIAHPSIIIKSNNAGFTLMALNINKNILGGDVKFIGNFNARNNLEGHIDIQKYHMINMPSITKLLNFAGITLGSVGSVKDALGGKGFEFQNMLCKISKIDNIVAISDCKAKGSSVVITANGDIDFEKDIVNIKGKLVPQNIINAAVKKIPLISKVLGGKDNSGLITMRYTITGKTSDASVSINPLSVITPDIISDLIDK